jgi:DNA-nicking Smr family endonuclease
MHKPFEVLEEWIRQGRLRLADAPTATGPEVEEPVPPSPPEELGDDALFQAAMRDVRPLRWNEAPLPSPQPVEIPAGGDEEAALKVLEEFCRGGQVGPEHLREYAEHSSHPVGRLYLNDLRSGRFAIQAHLDLHGLTVAGAREAVAVFLRDSVRAGFTTVRIVHGRGRHSTDRPLMKENVERWLRHRRLARFVIAYTSARVIDGGGGAVYVLLRRGA